MSCAAVESLRRPGSDSEASHRARVPSPPAYGQRTVDGRPPTRWATTHAVLDGVFDAPAPSLYVANRTVATHACRWHRRSRHRAVGLWFRSRLRLEHLKRATWRSRRRRCWDDAVSPPLLVIATLSHRQRTGCISLTFYSTSRSPTSLGTGGLLGSDRYCRGAPQV